jgi:hypothetical protein
VIAFCAIGSCFEAEGRSDTGLRVCIADKISMSQVDAKRRTMIVTHPSHVDVDGGCLGCRDALVMLV